MQEAMNENLNETILSSETVFEGDIFNVDHVDVLVADGSPATRDIIRHSGAVGIIALDGKGNILIVRQYRTSLERITAEIPAGRLEPGEDPLECATRELSEETGYNAEHIEYVGAIASAAGYSDELVHIVYAHGLTPGKAHPDEDEFVASEWVNIDDIVDAVLSGEIEDSKTMVAALMADAQRRRGTWKSL